MIVCPFCNSQINAVANRVHPICPRCDASLPAELVAQLPASDLVAGLPAAPNVPMPFAPGKKKTILTLLGFMALLAVVSAVFILQTKDARRANDRKKGFVPSEPASSPPSEMTAVGFIPARCHVVGAVNLADLRANTVAKKAVFDKMPRSIDWLASKLTDSTGLTLDDLTQAAVGVEVIETDGLISNFKIYVVVQTQRGYDPEAVLKPLGRRSTEAVRKRPFVRFPLPYVGQGVAWAMTSNHVAFLFSLDERPTSDLEAIPDRPRRKLEGSSATIQALVEERVDKQSLAWAVAEMRSVGDFLSGLGARTEAYRPLLEAKALTLSVKTDNDVVVLAQVLPRSAKEAAAVETWFKTTDWRGETSKKVESTPPDAGDPWVTLQLRYPPEAIAGLLSQGPGLKK